MVKTHVDKNYTLGLDSFYFQNKLIQMEYDNMKSIFTILLITAFIVNTINY